jgi:geranylgeranyl pyrophosphate synthase
MYLRGQRKIDKLSKYVKLIDTALLDVSQKNTGLEKIISSSIGNGGKRVRPIISLLMCEVACGDYQPAIPVALSYELAHVASLIQDDIIDRAEIRRGKPSIHYEFGIEKAILSSDLLIFEIFDQLSEYESWNLEPKRLYMLLKIISESSKSAAVGEYLQLEMSKKELLTERDYIKMIRKKTGSLLAAPAASGAIVGGAPEEEIEQAFSFGMSLGIAYQIQDDLLDILGKPGELGKPVFKDLERKNNNIVTVYAQNNVCEKDLRLINSIEDKESPSQRDKMDLRNILIKNGSVDYAIKLASEKYNESRTVLQRFKPGPARHRLLEITFMLSNRAYSKSILSFRNKYKN